MNLRKRWRRGARASYALVFLSVGVAVGMAPVSADTGVTVNASVDGQPVGKSSQIQPVKLFPRQESLLTLEVTNQTTSTIEVRKVRLQGQVIGLTFFEYDTSVSMSVAPGTTESRRLVLDLSGLDGQATGLIPGSVKLLDNNRHVVASQNGVVDVRGSLRSVYGLFGLGVAFLTALSFLGALVGLARHRLPQNRWRRGLRFLTPGLGLGLVVNFTLSATRVFVPEIGRWVTITAVCAAVLFGLGYLTPTPDMEEVEEPSTQVIEEITVLAIAARPGSPGLPGHPVAGALPADTGAAGRPPALAPAEPGRGDHRGSPDAPLPPRPVASPPAPVSTSPAPGPPEPASDARVTLPVGFTGPAHSEGPSAAAPGEVSRPVDQ